MWSALSMGYVFLILFRRLKLKFCYDDQVKNVFQQLKMLKPYRYVTYETKLMQQSLKQSFR